MRGSDVSQRIRWRDSESERVGEEDMCKEYV